MVSFNNCHLFFDLTSEIAEIPCSLEGNIPEWLSGTLLRNGPALFTAGGKRVNSWFDGLAMLHAFAFTQDKVTYSNRFLRTAQYTTMVEKHSLSFKGFAQDPCGLRFKSFFSHFLPNATVSIADYAGKMVALTEVPLPVVFDSKTLETIGGFPYSDALPQDNIFESAHPQVSHGELVNYLVEFGRENAYVIWKLIGKERTPIAKIPVDRPAYMHSFALTEKYIILVEYPFVVRPLDFLISGKPFIENYKWEPERGTTFLMVDRKSGEIAARIKEKPFFAFHHVNAYDEGEKVVIDVITYDDVEVIKMVSRDTVEEKTFPPTRLERFRLSPEEGSLTRHTLFSESVEMPKVNMIKTAAPYHFCYAIDAAFPTSPEESLPLYKIDVVTQQCKRWAEKGCYPGEPLFVPKPGATAEDDGVVLSLVLDIFHHTSFLLILDAKEWKEIGRAYAPYAIPVGLHGYFKTPI